jgi:hypothetical protein
VQIIFKSEISALRGSKQAIEMLDICKFQVLVNQLMQKPGKCFSKSESVKQQEHVMDRKFFYALGLGTLMLAGGHARIMAAEVKPPPLPLGSDEILVRPGEDLNEDARGKSAHKQKNKKNKGSSEPSSDDGDSKGSSANKKSGP